MGDTLRNLLTLAWLLPLAGFVAEIYALRWTHRLSKAPAYIAVGCIAAGFVCSFAALLTWGTGTDWAALKDHHGEHHAAAHGEDHPSDGADADEHNAATDDDKPHDEQAADHTAPADALAAHPTDPAAPADHHGDDDHADAAHAHPAAPVPVTYGGTFYTLGTFGPLVVSLDWYIDSLTLVMFTMVTFIATCIHVFAIGYMHDELTEDYVDHEVHLPGHAHFHRPGRFHRFFAFLSLFSFSMLGLVLAGNIFQVFIFWELVGVCSYLLIGFYVERQTASTAANKAFIMNRVGDFGFLIGLMIIWTSLGTFRFFDVPATAEATAQTGIFHLVRGTDGEFQLSEDGKQVYLQDAHGALLTDAGQPRTIPYYLLVTLGLGIFAGCIGKSAQFPLQTWLPDAMEGPTPVSALVHSATMVAAGVYLAGRFYPMFTPEVLLTIAYIGCITLFLAATIALVVTDIKRVLAYSTISQLGYMMLGIGVGGWGAGLFHLVTHAFFKSLLFLCSGSVIAGCHHVQDMRLMGGLRRKMPLTAATMLVGVVAIAGLAIPGIAIFGERIAFSGFHSKDAIVATALAYSKLNAVHGLLFFVHHGGNHRVLHVPLVVYDFRGAGERRTRLRRSPREPGGDGRAVVRAVDPRGDLRGRRGRGPAVQTPRLQRARPGGGGFRGRSTGQSRLADARAGPCGPRHRRGIGAPRGVPRDRVGLCPVLPAGGESRRHRETVFGAACLPDRQMAVRRTVRRLVRPPDAYRRPVVPGVRRQGARRAAQRLGQMDDRGLKLGSLVR